MRPGLAKIIEKVRISWYFESPETDLHIADNACCIDYADTWSSKRVHWLSKSQSPDGGTSDYRCEETLELYTGVTQVCLPITGIHTWVASKSKTHWIPATVHNTGWIDDWEVCHGSIEAIPILGPVDVEVAYSHIASRYHSVQWHVRPHGQPGVSFGLEENSMERRLVLRGEVSSIETVQILCWSDSNDGHASYFCTYPWSFLEVAIVLKVGQEMDINPENKTSYATQYQAAFLKYVENKYCAKHRRVPVNKLQSLLSINSIFSTTASGCCQSFIDPYDSSSDNEEYLTHNNVPETTPRRSDRPAHLLTATRLYLNSPPEAPKNWG